MALLTTIENSRQKPLLASDLEHMQAEIALQSWYWASATYKATVPGKKQKRPLWQDIVFIFQANTDDVQAVASEIAQKKEHRYENSKGSEVRWIFQKINQIEELFDRQPQNGTEVYWKLYEKLDKPDPA